MGAKAVSQSKVDPSGQAPTAQDSHDMVQAEKLPVWLVLQVRHSDGHALGDKKKKKAVSKVRSRMEGIVVGA